MVNLVIVSHSARLGEGVGELVITWACTPLPRHSNKMMKPVNAGREIPPVIHPGQRLFPHPQRSSVAWLRRVSGNASIRVVTFSPAPVST